MKQIHEYDTLIANSQLRTGKYEQAVETYSRIITQSTFDDKDLIICLSRILQGGNPHEQVTALQVLSLWNYEQRGIRPRVSLKPEYHQTIFNIIADESMEKGKEFTDIAVEYLGQNIIGLESSRENTPAFNHVYLVVPLAIKHLMPCHPSGVEIITGEITKGFGYQYEIRTTVYDMQFDAKVDDNGGGSYLERTIDGLVHKIKQDKPRIVAFSVRIGAWEVTSNMLSRIYSEEFGEDYKPAIILGGTVPTFAFGDILKEFPEVVCALGEGELSIRGFVEYTFSLDNSKRCLSKVPNIAYVANKSDKEIAVTERKVISIDDVAVPDRRIFESLMRGRLVNVNFETSRGCPYNCSYCAIESFRQTRRYRPHSVERVVSELEDLAIISGATKENPLNVHMTDDDFIGPFTQRPIEIARGILSHGLKGKFLINLETRADNIYHERDSHEQREQKELRLRRLKQAGVAKVFIGVESGSNSQLERYNKRITLVDVLGAFDTLQRIGLDVEAGFIMFDPLMSVDEVLENIDFIRKSGITESDTRPDKCMRAQEGTNYITMLQSKGLIRKPITPYEHEIYQKIYSTARLPLPGEFDVDTVSHGYLFSDENVRSLVSILLPWSAAMDEVIYYLQTIRRADSVSKRHWTNNSFELNSYLKSLRELVLDLTEELGHSLNDGNSDEDSARLVLGYEQKRQEIIEELRQRLKKGELRDTKDGQYGLLNAINNFQEKGMMRHQ